MSSTETNPNESASSEAANKEVEKLSNQSSQVENNANSNNNGRTQSFHNYHQVKREPSHRVFVNRSLQLSKIKFFGFDMDYTLALYKSPQYEILAFKLVIDQLIKLGYPKEIQQFIYDPSFPVRGLWYDKVYGNLLKMDAYNNILVCVHGFKFLKSGEIQKFYPNKYINFDESRFYVLNTLFSLPEIYLLACLINFFTTSPHFEHHETGVSSGDIFVSYKAIFQDVRCAIDYVHNHGDLKRLTVEKIEEYVVKDDRLAILFDRMHENNAKVFLLTNSGYEYTDKIMEFLLKDCQPGRHWKTYFDYILVDAHKPLFFAEGTSLKEINVDTGNKRFGSHSGPLKQNQVYSGGSVDVFSKLIGSRGKDVLYVGDHIFGDIIKSKKERAWRTFLVVPELAQEMVIWHEKRHLFSEVERLDKLLSEKLIDLDSSSKTCPNISSIKVQIQKSIHEMDMSYGLLGSLFRSGSRQTHFASQATRFADIYAASHLNLLHYPFFYLFKAPPMLMPHESTVNPYEFVSEDYGNLRRVSRGSSTLNIDSPNGMSSPGVDVANLTQAATARLNEALSQSPLTVANKNIHFGSQLAETPMPTLHEVSSDNILIKEIQEKVALSVSRPHTPSELTHHEDFDDDDEESDESKSSTNFVLS